MRVTGISPRERGPASEICRCLSAVESSNYLLNSKELDGLSPEEAATTTHFHAFETTEEPAVRRHLPCTAPGKSLNPVIDVPGNESLVGET